MCVSDPIQGCQCWSGRQCSLNSPTVSLCFLLSLTNSSVQAVEARGAAHVLLSEDGGDHIAVVVLVLHEAVIMELQVACALVCGGGREVHRPSEALGHLADLPAGGQQQ